MAASRYRQRDSMAIPLAAAIALALGLIMLMVTLNGCHHSDPSCGECGVQVGEPDAKSPGGKTTTPPDPETLDQPPTANSCADLDEQDCASDVECQPVFSGGVCGKDADAAYCSGANCNCTAPAFDRCEQRACGLVTAADLCMTRPDCHWVSDVCQPILECPDGGLAEPGKSCVADVPAVPDACALLDEEQCEASPDTCTPYYSADHCVCDPSGACACESETFVSCQPNPQIGT